MSRDSRATVRPREVIVTPRKFAVRLAALAKKIRRSVKQAMEAEPGSESLGALHAAFHESLIHDPTGDEFADLYAQTVTHCLFAAAVSRSRRGDETAIAAESIDALPIANPFLKEMLFAFLAVDSPRGRLALDPLGVQDLVELLGSPDTCLDRVLGDRDHPNGEDPVTHFYEAFLREYDPRRRVARGVFYTPRPVGSYLVRSVHELLQSEFGLEHGLADTATWGNVVERCAGMTLPDGVAAESPFVQILDPATGTGTFLTAVIDVIHRTLAAHWRREQLSPADQQAAWNDYVPRHLLPRLHGFELMPAPYAIAHIQIGLKLLETGYRFDSDDRVRVYLTNALEQPQDVVGPPTSNVLTFSRETRAVNAVKRDQRFTVILGNPPYSKISSNLTPPMRAIVERYRFAGGQRIRERGALQFEINLQDDYVKFFRSCQQQIEASGAGILGLVTNNGYLSTPTLRGMRDSLLETFSSIWVNDLHGHLAKGEAGPDAETEENVFDILQGVAVFLGSRTTSRRSESALFHAELYGSRARKYAFLQSHSHASTAYCRTTPAAPFYLFVPHDAGLAREWDRGVGLAELFPRNSAGIVTARDRLVIADDPQELALRIERFSKAGGDEASIYDEFGFSASKRFGLRKAQAALARLDSFSEPIRRVLHRPFDERHVFFHPSVVWSLSRPMAEAMRRGGNLALIATRQVTRPQFEHAFVSRHMIEIKACSHDRNTQIFPLFVQDPSDAHVSCETSTVNLNRELLERLADNLACKLRFDGNDSGSAGELTPRRMFDYAYAILYSPGYRARYFEFLRSDFPRLPITGNAEMFKTLARLGAELVALHLLESPELDPSTVRYVGLPNPAVEKVFYSHNSVWLDAAGTRGFQGVPDDVWAFRIGGYPVCAKWLKDRKGRALSQSDVEHYRKIIATLAETIRLMQEIDRTIERHGGWPAAFLCKTP